MRDIKFRAWDKEIKKYINLEKIVIDPLNGIVIETAGFDMIGNNDDAVLEQYTGLKDKNGVEVYEGDIVSAPVYGFIKIGVVEYSSSGEWLFLNIIRLSLFMDSLTIIGNIHENAELLEVD